MNFIFSWFGWLLGWPMSGLYYLTHNYGISILLFSVLMKILMIPFDIKQKKTQEKQQKLQQRMAEINKLYKDNKQRYEQETLKAYQEYGTPISGAIPFLVQLPIILGLTNLFYSPISNVLRISSAHISDINSIVTANKLALHVSDNQLGLISAVKQFPGLFRFCDQSSILTIRNFNTNLWGINLCNNPNFNSPSIIVFFLVLITTFHPMIKSFKQLFTNKKQNNSMSQKYKAGIFIFALAGLGALSAVITFNLPVGVSIYWVSFGLISIIAAKLDTVYSHKINKKE